MTTSRFTVLYLHLIVVETREKGIILGLELCNDAFLKLECCSRLSFISASETIGMCPFSIRFENRIFQWRWAGRLPFIVSLFSDFRLLHTCEWGFSRPRTTACMAGRVPFL